MLIHSLESLFCFDDHPPKKNNQLEKTGFMIISTTYRSLILRVNTVVSKECMVTPSPDGRLNSQSVPSLGIIVCACVFKSMAQSKQGPWSIFTSTKRAIPGLNDVYLFRAAAVHPTHLFFCFGGRKGRENMYLLIFHQITQGSVSGSHLLYSHNCSVRYSRLKDNV